MVHLSYNNTNSLAFIPAVQVIATFRERAALSAQHQIGTTGLLLVEGVSKRSTPEKPELVGRLDNNRRCIVPGTGQGAW